MKIKNKNTTRRPKFLLLSPSQLQRQLHWRQITSKNRRYAEIVLKRQQCLFMLQAGLLSRTREFHERRLNSSRAPRVGITLTGTCNGNSFIPIMVLFIFIYLVWISICSHCMKDNLQSNCEVYTHGNVQRIPTSLLNSSFYIYTLVWFHILH